MKICALVIFLIYLFFITIIVIKVVVVTKLKYRLLREAYPEKYSMFTNFLYFHFVSSFILDFKLLWWYWHPWLYKIKLNTNYTDRVKLLYSKLHRNVIIFRKVAIAFIIFYLLAFEVFPVLCTTSMP